MSAADSISFDLGARSDDRPAAWPTAAMLAERFGDKMREQLSLEDLCAANRDNKAAGYVADTCATHDHCDANMVLLDAWTDCLGIDEEEAGDLNDQRMLDLWSEAWNIAKRAHFGVPEELERNDDGTFGFIASGIAIDWPLASENSIEDCSPDYYGFTISHTGGNCTAWRRDFTYKGKPVHMLLTSEDSSHEVERGDVLVWGVYSEEVGDEWFVNWQSREATGDEERGPREFITTDGAPE